MTTQQQAPAIEWVTTPIGRLSYCNLQVPKQQKLDNGSTKPVWSTNVIWTPADYPGLTPLINLCKKVAREKWGEKIPGNVKWPLRDNSTYAVDSRGNPRDGYTEAGQFASFRTDRGAPVFKGPDTTDLILTPNVLYAGGYARVSCSAYAWTNTNEQNITTNGVGLNLIAVQWIKDGEPFGSTVSYDESMFGAVEVEDATALGAPAGSGTPGSDLFD